MLINFANSTLQNLYRAQRYNKLLNYTTPKCIFLRKVEKMVHFFTQSRENLRKVDFLWQNERKTWKQYFLTEKVEKLPFLPIKHVRACVYQYFFVILHSNNNKKKETNGRNHPT